MKIGVTGADGFLGSRILSYYQDKYKMTGYRHSDMDFTDLKQAERILKKDCPDILIHTAAVSDVGACEKDPDGSEKINVEGVKNLAVVCSEIGARMIFCSSDQVYVGNSVAEPHREGEDLSPPTVYGRQKIKAEELAFSILPDTVALRLSWMFAADFREGKEHGNLISSVCQTVKDGKCIQYPVYDRRSITNVWEVVRNIEIMFQAPAGIYNFGSENNESTYDVVKGFMENAGMDPGFLKKNEKAFQDCPRNLRMNMEKVKKAGASFMTTLEALCQTGRDMRNKD